MRLIIRIMAVCCDILHLAFILVFNREIMAVVGVQTLDVVMLVLFELVSFVVEVRDVVFMVVLMIRINMMSRIENMFFVAVGDYLRWVTICIRVVATSVVRICAVVSVPMASVVLLMLVFVISMM